MGAIFLRAGVFGWVWGSILGGGPGLLRWGGG